MDSVRLFLLTASILSAMLGGLYVSHGEAAARPVATLASEDEHVVAPIEPPSTDTAASLPTGLDVPVEAPEDLKADLFADPVTGVTLGPLVFRPIATAAVPEVRPAAADRGRRVAVRREPVVRLDADPGRNVILTARGMMARNETVRGSCYAYITEVFHRAGHDGWRTRSVIHEAGPSGPYADLDRIRPGDWLYIVNNPDSTPMGTHSVLFVGWEDRSQGYARTISHPGWAAGAHPGRESSYDLSRTYRVIRPR
ncbi:MAG: hypothetical protein J0L92_32915 [Deltaproteobacteria bacterium]|nr:hypothetical protein [Deltaproteobacteria bacterium]